MNWNNVPKMDFKWDDFNHTAHVGALGLAANQTWKTRGGRIVHVVSATSDDRFKVETENGMSYWTVNAYGQSKLISREYDLVSRVDRVYIAGPMTGHVDLNFPAFNAAAAEYRKRGAFVINPAEMNGGSDEIVKSAKMTPEQYHAHWVGCMKKDINALMTCDTIVVLPGWQKSRGAKLEHHVARNLGLTVTYLDQ